MSLETKITALAQAIGDDIQSLKMFPVQISGQFLLDPNEVNGWGVQGFVDNSNTVDWGNATNSGASNIANLSPNTMGGFMFPFDVRLVAMEAMHDNSNTSAEAWGWVILRQSFTYDTNTEVTSVLLDEISTGIGTRDYLDSNRQHTLITNTSNNSGFDNFISNDIIPAGETIGLGVAAPTAVATNYYVRIHSGYMLFERV